MNTSLYRRLREKGNMRIVKELEQRAKLLAGSEKLVYSTKDAARINKEAIANKGCMPCSDDLAVNTSLDNMKSSNRTRFYMFGGNLCCNQKHSYRLMGK